VNETSRAPESMDVDGDSQSNFDSDFNNGPTAGEFDDESSGAFDLRHVFSRVLNSVAANSARWYEDPEPEDDFDNQNDDDGSEQSEAEESGEQPCMASCCHIHSYPTPRHRISSISPCTTGKARRSVVSMA
jgi:hypothetical protein